MPEFIRDIHSLSEQVRLEDASSPRYFLCTLANVLSQNYTREQDTWKGGRYGAGHLAAGLREVHPFEWKRGETIGEGRMVGYILCFYPSQY